MQAYKYETTVLKDGILRIPELKALENHKVEIIIIDEGNGKSANTNKISTQEFLSKWSGFLGKETDEDLKFDYLEEKYK